MGLKGSLDRRSRGPLRGSAMIPHKYEWISAEDYVAIADVVERYRRDMCQDGRWALYQLRRAPWLFELGCLGFELHHVRSYKILVHLEKKLVLKCSFVPGLAEIGVPAKAIPTEILAVNGRHAIILQPLAEADEDTRYAVFSAMEKLRAEGRQIYPIRDVEDEFARVYGTDRHAGNYAKWNGLDVVIDW